MLPTALVKEISRLLKEGELSHRQIARHLGVGRGTINAIATGRRELHGKEPIKRQLTRGALSRPIRCPRCGFRVYMPCRICRMRQYRDGQVLVELLARRDEPMGQQSPRSDPMARKDGAKHQFQARRARKRYFRAS